MQAALKTCPFCGDEAIRDQGDRRSHPACLVFCHGAEINIRNVEFTPSHTRISFKRHCPQRMEQKRMSCRVSRKNHKDLNAHTAGPKQPTPRQLTWHLNYECKGCEFSRGQRTTAWVSLVNFIS